VHLDRLLIVAVGLALAHFGLPLAYYTYLRVRWLGRPWGIGRDPGYRPRVTVVVPTYNELVELWFLPKSTEARGISTKTVKNISEFTHDTRRY
jgi:cellulose synthase/poly-beta-1,6-N-acetylglucosamine synthase-like glycosyltransferase